MSDWSRTSEQHARTKRTMRRQCPEHGQELVLVDPMPGAPVIARFDCPDPFCGYKVERDRFALLVDV